MLSRPAADRDVLCGPYVRIVERPDLPAIVQDTYPFVVAVYPAVDQELCQCQALGRIKPEHLAEFVDQAGSRSGAT